MIGSHRNEIRKGVLHTMLVCGTVTAIIVMSLVLPSVRALPSTVGCASDTDCDPGHCCVAGAYRYGVQCQPTKAEGEECSPAFDKVHDLAMTFPDGEHANLKVHHIYCGCSQGLHCNNGTCAVKP